jgi:ribonuclease BN (tRNA processing enzyme)
MQVTTYGTRGSIPVSSPDKVKYGGNTTCLRVDSPCLPLGTWLAIDAGSGFVPFAYDALQDGVLQVIMLMTHHHHDHNQGLPLAPLTFIKEKPIHVYGPVQDGWTPRKVLEAIMQKPLFPVPFCQVASHFHTHDLQYPQSNVLLIHPEGGHKLMQIDAYERLMSKAAPITFKNKRTFPVDECLVVTMHTAEHPEATVSYRFEERPTGKTFAFLTDHENQDGVPLSLRHHLRGVDLLIQDTQYDPVTYHERTAGFGHGTPDFAVRLANLVGAKRLGTFHHDPRSSDDKVDQIVELAREAAASARKDAGKGDKARLLIPSNIFACADYMTIEV